MSADSNEFGSNSARLNARARMFRAMRDQSASPDGFSSLQTLSTNGAAVNKPATHGRTSSVISDCGKRSRTAFIAGIASTASPTQFGPRIRIFSTSIKNQDRRSQTAATAIQDKRHQAFEVRNLSRDPQVAAGRSVTVRRRTASFSGDKHLAPKIVISRAGPTVMVAKADTLRGNDSKGFKRAEKTFRFCDAGECDDVPVLEFFRSDGRILFVYALNLSPDGERRNRQVRNPDAGNVLHAGGVAAADGSFRFAPPARWEKEFAGGPFHGIDGYDVHIAMKPPMLKSVIKDKNVPELSPAKSGFISVRDGATGVPPAASGASSPPVPNSRPHRPTT